jgi:hypothetical protein
MQVQDVDDKVTKLFSRLKACSRTKVMGIDEYRL